MNDVICINGMLDGPEPTQAYGLPGTAVRKQMRMLDETARKACGMYASLATLWKSSHDGSLPHANRKAAQQNMRPAGRYFIVISSCVGSSKGTWAG